MNNGPDTKRLNYVGYANISFGILSLLCWALPGPWVVQYMWATLDHMNLHPDDHVVLVVKTVMKAAIVAVVAVYWALSAVSVLNGVLILKRRRYRTCLVLSGVSILGNAFGLIIGTISLIALTQDWARALFSEGSLRQS